MWALPLAYPGAHQWAGLKTIIKVTSYRHILKGQLLWIKEPAVRYNISSLEELVESFVRRIREYGHVEKRGDPARVFRDRERAPRHKIHCLSLNLHREHGFDNMAQAQRKA